MTVSDYLRFGGTDRTLIILGDCKFHYRIVSPDLKVGPTSDVGGGSVGAWSRERSWPIAITRDTAVPTTMH